MVKIDKRARRMGRRMLALYQETDPVVQERAVQLGATCREGCAHCCNLLTVVTLPEAVAIVEHVLDQPLGAVRLDGYIRRARENISAFIAGGAFTPAGYFAVQTRCAFLGTDNRCQVYAVRPQECRTHYVVSDPELCKGPDTHIVAKVDMEPVRLATMREAGRGLEQEDIGFFLAPLPVLILYASVLLQGGREAFMKMVAAPPHPVFDLSLWQAETLLMLNNAEAEYLAKKAERPELSSAAPSVAGHDDEAPP